MTSIKIISLILALIGLSITFGISLQIYSFLAPFLAAVNGIASGGEVATTKIPTRKFSSLQISIYMWLGILLTHAPASLLLGETWYPIGFNVVWLSMVGYSVVGLVSFWLVIEGFKYVDASIGGLIGLLEIIFGIVFGILIFQEQLTAATIVGGCLIIASAMLPDSVTLLKKK